MTRKGSSKGVQTLKTLLLCCLFSVTTLAADFTMRIVTYPRDLPKGAPMFIRGLLCNASGHAITVAHGYQGFVVSFNIRRTDGQPITNCPQMTIRPAIGYTLETLPPNWLQEEMRTVCYGNATGEFVVQIILSSKAPYRQVDGTAVTAWEGEIHSEEVHVTVTEPTGIDAEAFKHMKGIVTYYGRITVLDTYPTSTYAAYALCEKLDITYFSQRPLEAGSLDDIRQQAIGHVDPSDPRGKHFYALDAPLRDAEISLLQTVLRAHHYFPFRYLFDYRLGYDYFSARDFKLARSYFGKCLGSEIPERIRAVAKVHLDVLDEKGIK